ncbi:MAG TPA: winged helix-turn-helix domain-containing protein [Candidatus Woesebacteria bacterium]|mgnify:CR=1 FL=1|nr:winged helix-turn-helix domain-containing protein [Candidatus Woesebacteria bacterium]
MTKIDDLMISKVRVKILQLFFSQQGNLFYVREITRLINEEINAVRRELDRMLGFGLLKSEQRGNRLYYRLNDRYLFHQELRQMVAKTTGLGTKIIQLKRKLGTLQFVMFSSKFAGGIAPTQGEVDVLVVGDVVLSELELLIKQEQERLNREINYTVFDEQEFIFRKTRRDPFIMDVLMTGRVMIIGSEVEFAERKIPGVN